MATGAAPATPEAELLSEMSRGLLVTQMERGLADPVSGNFLLQVTEAFLIEAGRATRPLLPFGLVGNTRSFLAGIDGLGDRLGWDDGCGTCGREDQWLRVSVGQPALRVAEGTLGVA